MIRLIYGSKGSGKTGKMIYDANAMVQQSDGEVVFLTDTDKYQLKINYNIRLVNVKKYDIASADELSGMIRGLIAGNADITHIYIDGVHRMAQTDFDHLAGFFAELAKISEAHNVELVLSISSDALPAYMNAYQQQHA